MLVDQLTGRLAQAMTGASLHAQQQRIRAVVRRLQRRPRLERVHRHDAIIAFRRERLNNLGWLILPQPESGCFVENLQTVGKM